MENKQRVQSYLFVPASENKSLVKSSELVKNEKTTRIIDLEDSVKDAIDIERFGRLKEEARKSLLEYLPNDNESFCLRINDLRSSFWQEDIKLISSLKDKMDFKNLCQGIVLSKTNSAEEIRQLTSILNDKGLSPAIIPLIETLQGMDNLGQIINEKNIKSIIFGHHDYFYEKGIFPIPNTALSSKVYRDTLEQITSILKDNKIELIDGICPYLYDKEIMQNSCRYLYQQNKDGHLGKLALNPKQVEAINSTDDWDKELELTSEDDEVSLEKKRDMARELIKMYENRSTAKLGVGRTEEKYLSPQQYYLAQEILSEDNEKNREQTNIKFR
jgi:citrate lyase beta subunit